MEESTGTECGCKGIRTCLICEGKINASSCFYSKKKLFYCTICRQVFSQLHAANKAHIKVETDDSLSISGIFVLDDFLTEDEESSFVKSIDVHPWVPSQSGRKKQDFGPKVNFKKQKVNTSNFCGFPGFVKPLIEKVQSADYLLQDFHPVELCNLEYVPERGAAIDPHLDDSWLWGERLVTINMLSDTFLTLTPCDITTPNFEVLIPMKKRSLVILYGEARHRWYHSISRDNIKDRRIAMTFRELATEFLPNGRQEDIGKLLLKTAKLFFI